jgi:hypothetical protein
LREFQKEEDEIEETNVMRSNEIIQTEKVQPEIGARVNHLRGLKADKTRISVKQRSLRSHRLGMRSNTPPTSKAKIEKYKMTEWKRCDRCENLQNESKKK